MSRVVGNGDMQHTSAASHDMRPSETSQISVRNFCDFKIT